MIEESTILSEVARYILEAHQALDQDTTIDRKMVFKDCRSIIGFCERMLEKSGPSFHQQLLQEMDEVVLIWYYDEDEGILEELTRFIDEN